MPPVPPLQLLAQARLDDHLGIVACGAVHDAVEIVLVDHLEVSPGVKTSHNGLAQLLDLGASLLGAGKAIGIAARLALLKY